MESQFIFRIILIVLFAVLGSIGVYHRSRAHRSNDREKVSRKEEGWFILVTLRVFGFATWIGLILFMVDPEWMRWSYMSLPIWARWCGVAVVITTIPLMYWMFSSLGNNVTDTVATRKLHTMVTHGPYQYVRHPMYAIVFLLFNGFMLLTTSWFIGLAGLGTMMLLIARTPIEERNLTRRFGKAYEDYKARTNRFIPGIRF